ncbi:MAG: enolase C-terminal domain-like protein [Marinobacter sp.]|uniref:mandelate racemase/muconate lactonizing enzyme family protein n=1 Tax=Marinobacter sp. TaxID=50741 RepID=UPI00299F3E9E|nr:enolase C-terminal domain-like protein [Marinobacter sp.]MDX1757492.1 enolase C-terminal domain-like protein [Marinobacter sp.]
MKIVDLKAYQAELRYDGPAYAFANGRSYQRFLSTVVVLTTDDGLEGYGEVCPCGPRYMPAFAEGIPSCLAQLASGVLGEDPRHTTRIVQRMNEVLSGHPVAKAAIDMACWDLLGKAVGLPLYVLLGGLLSESMPLHRILPLASSDEVNASLSILRQQQFHHFQLKLGRAVEEDLALLDGLEGVCRPGEVWVGDVNGAWRPEEAIRFSRQLADIPLYLEEPCGDYLQNLSVRPRLQHPVKLDESLHSLADVLRALHDNAMDAMALKLSKFGGLTVARRVRDLCVAHGIPMTIEDAWGSGIATAAYAHLAASTPPHYLLNTTDLHNYNTTQLALGAPYVEQGRMTMSAEAGLGVQPDFGQMRRIELG